MAPQKPYVKRLRIGFHEGAVCVIARAFGWACLFSFPYPCTFQAFRVHTLSEGSHRLSDPWP